MKKKPDVLVLNRNFTPVHICEWQKCMSLIFQEAARPIDRDFIVYEYKDWLEFSIKNSEFYPTVGTVTGKIALPEIIVLRYYDRLPTRDVKYSRQTLFERDHYTCAYCGGVYDKKKLTIDHITPRSHGGKTTWMNTITSCFTCNNYKADRTPEQANMHLRYKPRKPQWLSPLSHIKPDHPCKSWTPFMKKVSIEHED